MKVTRKYPIVVVQEKKEYWAYIPDIPGIYGRGKTAKKAKEDIRQALSLYIEDCVADGDKIPVSSAKVVLEFGVWPFNLINLCQRLFFLAS